MPGNRYFQRYFCYSDECVDTKPQNKPRGVERCAEEGGEEDGNEEEESSYYGACYSGRTTVEVHSSTSSHQLTRKELSEVKVGDEIVACK